MKRQLDLLDHEPHETAEDTRDLVRRVTAKLQGIKPKRKMRWLCLKLQLRLVG